jgi:hypothetical protein
MALEREWQQLAEEEFFHAAVEKAELNYLHNLNFPDHQHVILFLCGLFLY